MASQPALNPVAVHAGVDAAFVLVETGPAAVAIAFAGVQPPGAGNAADGGIAVLHQRMARQRVLGEIRFEIAGAPLGQRIEAEAALEIFDRGHGGAGMGLEALASGDDGIEAVERAAQRPYLAQVAAGIGMLGPQNARSE